MKTQLECEALAKAKLEEYVNECKCNSVGEVANAIRKILAMSMHALDVVANGNKEQIH